MNVLVGTAKGLFHLGDSERRELDGHDVTSLARDGDSVWAIIGQSELWRDGDRVTSSDGRRWQCLLPLGDEVLVGADDATLQRVVDSKVVIDAAFAAAPARETWYTPSGGPPDVRSMTSAIDGTVYVNVHVGGVLRGPEAWTPTLDIDADVHQVLADPDDARTVYAPSADGLGVTTDGGQTWHFKHDGAHGRYMRSVAIAGAWLLAGVASDFRGSDGALYRIDRGLAGRFERVGPSRIPGHVDTHALVADGPHVAFGTHDGEVYVSEDAGATWARITDGLPEIRCLIL